ncbi:MAG: hypothetical protein Q9219_000600 [cf. Caloplaca sp. 3 TL-2023]
MAPHKKQRPATRKLVRWNDNMDMKLLLTIQWACNQKNIKLPWEMIGHEMGETITESAVVQHLSKKRTRMEEQGIPVPPPLTRGGSNKKKDKKKSENQDTEKKTKTGRVTKPVARKKYSRRRESSEADSEEFKPTGGKSRAPKSRLKEEPRPQTPVEDRELAESVHSDDDGSERYAVGDPMWDLNTKNCIEPKSVRSESSGKSSSETTKMVVLKIGKEGFQELGITAASDVDTDLDTATVTSNESNVDFEEIVSCGARATKGFKSVGHDHFEASNAHDMSVLRGSDPDQEGLWTIPAGHKGRTMVVRTNDVGKGHGVDAVVHGGHVSTSICNRAPKTFSEFNEGYGRTTNAAHTETFIPATAPENFSGEVAGMSEFVNGHFRFEDSGVFNVEYHGEGDVIRYHGADSFVTGHHPDNFLHSQSSNFNPAFGTVSGELDAFHDETGCMSQSTGFCVDGVSLTPPGFHPHDSTGHEGYGSHTEHLQSQYMASRFNEPTLPAQLYMATYGGSSPGPILSSLLNDNEDFDCTKRFSEDFS